MIKGINEMSNNSIEEDQAWSNLSEEDKEVITIIYEECHDAKWEEIRQSFLHRGASFLDFLKDVYDIRQEMNYSRSEFLISLENSRKKQMQMFQNIDNILSLG